MKLPRHSELSIPLSAVLRPSCHTCNHPVTRADAAARARARIGGRRTAAGEPTTPSRAPTDAARVPPRTPTDPPTAAGRDRGRVGPTAGPPYYSLQKAKKLLAVS